MSDLLYHLLINDCCTHCLDEDNATGIVNDTCSVLSRTHDFVCIAVTSHKTSVYTGRFSLI